MFYTYIAGFTNTKQNIIKVGCNIFVNLYHNKWGYLVLGLDGDDDSEVYVEVESSYSAYSTVQSGLPFCIDNMALRDIRR